MRCWNRPSPDRLAIVVMGPSGCGKSTLARALSVALGRRFVEGDALHPPANVARMAAGLPLDDAARAPFLAAVAGALGRGGDAVAACSALKRRYRDRLRAGAGPILFVWPRVPPDVLAARLAGRPGHFMPPSLLASQLADLEPPGTDETAVTVDGARPVSVQVAAVRTALDL